MLVGSHLFNYSYTICILMGIFSGEILTTSEREAYREETNENYDRFFTFVMCL